MAKEVIQKEMSSKIKKQWKLKQNNTVLQPDNCEGMITHLEPDMSECKVKWALGSITANKASGVKEFQLSYFKS